MNRCASPCGEDAYGRQFGNVQPGPADYQLDQRLALSRGSEQRNPAQSSGERKTDGWRGMHRAWGRRLGETVTEHYWAEDRESFVTVATSDPDSEQDLTLTWWNLLDCLERETAVFFYLSLDVEALPLLQHSSASRCISESLCSGCRKTLYLQGNL